MIKIITTIIIRAAEINELMEEKKEEET